MTRFSPPAIVATLVMLSLSSLSAPSFAQNPDGDYEFDELLCAPKTTHSIISKRPSLLTILDTSGSMSSPGNSLGIPKLAIAQLVVSEVASSVTRPGPCTAENYSGCDIVEMGVGQFNDEGRAEVTVQPGEGQALLIGNAVLGYVADGATYIGEAAKLIYDNDKLGNGQSVGISVLVSDGHPSTDQTTRQTVHYLCAARDRKPRTVLTFAVGFGQGASPELNNLFAAAGGTGFCCKGGGQACEDNPDHIARFDPCTGFSRVASDEIDPGNYPYDGQVSCYGGLQADSGQALKDAFFGILKRSICTFPLEIPEDYPAGIGADPNPEATRVKFNHRVLGDNIEVPYVGGEPYILAPGDAEPKVDPSKPVSDELYKRLKMTFPPIVDATAQNYIGEGWIWANSDRSAIILTPGLCEDVIYKYEVTEVVTEVACLCNYTNEACEVPCFKEKCLETANCVSKTGAAKEECEKGCRNDPSSVCEQGFNELYDRTESQQVGRCSPGIIECIKGQEYCAPLHEPQPEICNGMDDSCSGKVDDLSSSTTSSDYATQLNPEVQGVLASMPPGSQGLFCGFKDDACGCAGAPNGYGTPTIMTAEHGFKEVMRLSQLPENSCRCVETLEGPGPLSPEVQGQSAAPAGPQAGGCASTPSAPAPGTLLLPLLLGWFVLRRRRQG